MSVKPTIALIPSAYNTSKIYSVLPTDDSGDFSFSRTTKGTRINKDGLVEVIDIDTPRLDYSDGNCPKLLLEKQATNLYVNSATLVTQSVTTTATSYTVTFYGTGTITFSGSYVGSLVGTSYNDRVSLTFTASSGTLINTVSGDVRNAQIELGTVATSYIDSLGISTTRTKDNAYLYNYPQLTSYPFTVYAEAEIEAFGNVPFSITDSAANNKYLLVSFTSSSSIGVLRRDAATNDSDYHFGYSWAIGQNVKVAIAFINATSYRLFINGDEIAYITSGGSIPFSHNDIILGQFRVASDTGTRNSVKDFRFYNQELTDTQMRELTS